MSDKATGRDIILAILDNMRESSEPLLYNTLVPSHYDVYLHRTDYERLSGIFNRIRDESIKALSEEMQKSSRKRSSLLPGLKRRQPRVEAAGTDWFVKFHVDEDEELKPGDILIDSRFALPQPKQFGVGSKTQRTVTVRSGGETKKLGTYVKGEQAGPATTPAVARLAFHDKDGQRREYLMTGPEISIGRGGRTEYCDLELDAPPDISRQHFYLRQDGQTKAFHIQDVSRFGTAVNGKTVAPKEWVAIPAKATITLAGKYLIEFEGL
jgi:hypothetical protein